MIKYISFDLQGTLTDSNFSDNFWLNTLPTIYSKNHNISLLKSKVRLNELFKSFGKYDTRYYDNKYWENELSFVINDVLNDSKIKPKVNKNLFRLIDRIKVPVIIISTTTHPFIDFELNNKKNKFYKIYSCIDDFNIGGKTKDIYEKILEDLDIKPSELIHIGDNKEMDVDNANKAGIKAFLYTKEQEMEIIKKIEEDKYEGDN